jgi:ABC-type multidrug transport system fused ATPase/permease subunit
LLEPQKGTLEIDGQLINKNNLRSWQKMIGYVPQNIYLSDDTISSNIAFGVNKKSINQTQIEKEQKLLICISLLKMNYLKNMIL